jgi:apolipoprotein N-acyltransferase
LTVSLISFYQPEKKGLPYEVVVLQPNVDPYGEKFTGNNEEQLDDLLAQADAHVTKQTKMVIAPETALYPTAKIYEQSIRKEVFTHKINERRAKWNKAPFLIGASTYQGFDHKVSAAATYYKPFDIYIEDYNSSILFDHTQQPKIIHKSKLVLGVEKIPFVGAFPFLEKLAVQMEGGSGSLGVEKGPKVFQAGKVAFAPAICYESVYGEWVAQQCKQGAQFIAVITNDGWWKDTPGYKQHFHLARLRAIENRKYVVHAANTGTSGIISSKGEVLKTTAWWQKVAFNYTIQLNQEQTVYQQYGDILGVISVIVSISLLFTALFKILLRIKSRSLKH